MMAYQFVGKGHAGSTYEDAGSNPGIRRDINFAENDLSPQSRARLDVFYQRAPAEHDHCRLIFLCSCAVPRSCFSPPLMKQSNH